MKAPELTPWACIFWAGLLLTLPGPWLGAAFLGAAFHEACHILAIWALGGRMEEMTVGPFGAVIRVSGLSYGREFLAAAAGPAGSLLLLAILRAFPRLSLCGLIQGTFNLLPLYPLDGGRMVFCLFCLAFSQDQAVLFLEILRKVLVFILSAWGLFLGFRHSPAFLPLVFALISIFSTEYRKNPCNAGYTRVQ